MLKTTRRAHSSLPSISSSEVPFQVNEVFADLTSLRTPLWISKEALRRETTVGVATASATLVATGGVKAENFATGSVVVYTGVSAPSICRGMGTAEVAKLFSACKICIRAYDFTTGATRFPWQTSPVRG